MTDYKEHTYVVDSGKYTDRAFCPTCGLSTVRYYNGSRNSSSNLEYTFSLLCARTPNCLPVGEDDPERKLTTLGDSPPQT